MAGISGEPDPLAGHRSIDYPTPPLKKLPQMKMFHEAAEKPWLSSFRSSNCNVSEAYTNPDGQTLNACQYCAFCGSYGCEYGAKADPIVTVIPTAKKTGNFELRTHSISNSCFI